MRTKKVGTELELFAMSQIGKILESLPVDTRERVVNWVSAKTWDETHGTAVQPTTNALF